MRFRDHGDVQAREELARRLMPLVYSIARRYRAAGEPEEDVVQAGAVGLVKAIDRFDVEAGHRLVSFAVPNIQGEIKRHFRDHTWAVHVPRATQELGQRVRQVQREALESTGRQASLEDVARRLAVDRAAVIDAVHANDARDALSLSYPISGERELHDVHGRIDPGYARVDDRALIEDASSVLGDRDRSVVSQRFEEGRLQREIARDIGVSQMQVSRILTQATKQMRHHLDRPDCVPDAARAA